MSIDLVALKSELDHDPLSLGYAAPLAAGALATVAELLNATTGAGVATIALPSLSRDDFLAGIRPGLLALASLSATVQAKWDRIISVLCAATMVNMDATSQAVLASAVSDTVLTQAQSDAIWHRSGTRAEALFGADVGVQWQDVANAINS